MSPKEEKKNYYLDKSSHNAGNKFNSNIRKITLARSVRKGLQTEHQIKI